MAISSVTAIANAIAEASKVIGQWMASAERRRMQAAIEAGESYIFVNEKEGIFKNIPDDKQKAYLLHFKKRFFKSNN
jgi:hypothetical protein